MLPDRIESERGDVGPAAMLALGMASVQHVLAASGVPSWSTLITALAWGIAAVVAWRLAPVAMSLIAAKTQVSRAASERGWGLVALAIVASLALVPPLWQIGQAALDPSRGPLWTVAWQFAIDLTNADAAHRSWDPLELTLLAMLRNVGFGLAGLAAWRRFSGVAALVSLLLALCAMAAATDRIVVVLLALYAATACGWLAGRHWRQLEAPATLGRTVALSAKGMHRKRLPWAPVVLLTAAVVAAVSLAWFMPRRTLAAWSGLLRSSGGTETAQSSARDGVGSGDKLVGARDVAQSIGFVETEVYLETEQASLYDVFNEMYGKPPENRERQEAIALAAETNEQNQLPSEHLQAEEEFSAVREPPTGSQKPPDKAADALMYVDGRTPAHLRLAVYDRFDGVRWQPAPADRLALTVRAGGWIGCERSAAATAACGAADLHRIKIALLATGRLPAPSLLSAFRLGRVDQLRFFALEEGDLPQLATRKVPPGEVLETQSAPADPQQLAELEWSESYAAGFRAAYRDLPTSLDPTVTAQARAWTAGVPHGWPQIAAIVSGLRSSARLDRAATAPTDCRDVARHFLQAGSGPDYLFATTAAVMLRTLGYPTRLVGGFYAAPADYDPQTGHTPVRDDDAHVWLEVGLPGLGWVTVEPTPGYETLAPATPWHAAVWQWLAGWQAWAAARPALAALVVVLVPAGLWFRRELGDGLLTALWRVSLRLRPENSVAATLRLLERRARWSGCARPGCRTFRQWAFAVAPPSAPLAEFARTVDSCLYGRGSPIRATPACEAIVREWTLQQLAAVRRKR